MTSTTSRPRRFARAAIAAVALAALVGPATTVTARDRALTTNSKISTSGLGPVGIGLTKGQAQRFAKTRIDYQGGALGNCRYAAPRSLRVSFMLIDNRVARVDVSRRGFATPSGIRVGDSEASVRRQLQGRLRVSEHQYVRGGSYLEFVPRDNKDSNRRVIFESNGRRITYIRAGRLPEVRYIEGCA